MMDVLKHLEQFAMEHADRNILNRFSEKRIQEFWLGYLPKRSFPWGQYDPTLLSQLGLYYRDGAAGGYSPFDGRIIIPIYDRDRLVGIAGRVVEGKGAKYINTVFAKQEHFFTRPMQSFKGATGVALCEGYTDVMALSEAFDGTGIIPVGLMGLALGHHRVARLNKFGRRLVIVMDSDTAGNEGVFRMVPELMPLTIPISVLYETDGYDPDDRMSKGLAFPPEVSLAQFVHEHLKRTRPDRERIRYCVLHGFEAQIPC